jgi:hypothetical protein
MVTGGLRSCRTVERCPGLRRLLSNMRIYVPTAIANWQPACRSNSAAETCDFGAPWWSGLLGVGDDDCLTDECVFHGRAEEEVGDVCARG